MTYMTPLHRFADTKTDVQEIKKLIEKDPDSVNQPDDLGYTPLHLAAANNNNPQIVRTLIARGAIVDAKDSTGQTPLLEAARAHRTESLKILLDAGADPNAKDKGGSTALFEAAGAGHFAAIALLKAKGAKINIQKEDGNTPLHNAMLAEARGDDRDKAVVDELVYYGADPTTINNANQTPAQYAEEEAALRNRP